MGQAGRAMGLGGEGVSRPRSHWRERRCVLTGSLIRYLKSTVRTALSARRGAQQMQANGRGCRGL